MTVNFRQAADVPPDSAPRRGRPPGGGGDARKPRVSRASLRKQIDGLVVSINAIIEQLRPADALDGAEIATLVKALDEQAKTSPKFRRGLEAILSATGGASLVPVLGIIAARRLSRHRVIPPFIDPLGGVALQMMQAEPSEAKAAMDTVMGMMQGMGATPSDANGKPTDAAAE